MLLQLAFDHVGSMPMAKIKEFRAEKQVRTPSAALLRVLLAAGTGHAVALSWSKTKWNS